MASRQDVSQSGRRSQGGGVDDVDTDLFAKPDSNLSEPELPARTPRPAVTEDGHSVAPDPDVGDVVGGYHLQELLGRGGAGSVFKAQATEGEVVALKVLAASKVKRARVVQRFFDEVRAASLVQHEGLIRVLGFIEEEEPRRLAYAMEYVAGEMLRTRLKRERALDLRVAIQVGIQICEALSALHAGGIVHRDLKPENILLADTADGQPPKVKLLDFGVVKFLPVDRTAGIDAAEEKPGTFVGTPRYMAPEQAAGAQVDARADLFSVGVMLFEMITGRCPHEGDSLRDVVLAKLKGAPRITVNPEKEILPQELTDIVDACLQLKPSLRPDDARKVGHTLREAETVLFAVGPIRFGDGGATIRPSTSPAPTDSAEVEPPPPPIITLGRSRPGSVSVTPAQARSGISITARPPAAASSGSAPAPVSSSSSVAPTPTSSSTEPEADGSRRLILVLLGLAMVAAALMIALAARRITTVEDAVLVVPEVESSAPLEVRFAPERGARGSAGAKPESPQTGTSTIH